MKATDIRHGDWIVTGTKITDTVDYTRDYPDQGVVVTTSTGDEFSLHPDTEVTVPKDGHRIYHPTAIYRPTAGTISQLVARRHRLMRARYTTKERVTALIFAAARIVVALKVMNVEDPAA